MRLLSRTIALLTILGLVTAAPAQTLIGGGSGTPALSALAGTAASDAGTGTVVASPKATLAGCSWSIASQSSFAQSSSTGVVTKAATSVAAGSYAPTTTCSLTANSQTVTVSAALALTVTGSVSQMTFYGSDTAAPAQGAPDNFGVGFTSGATQAYLVLAKAGADETAQARELATTAFPWALLTPQSSGSYTLRAYDAVTGGTMLGESTAFTVTASALPSLPLAANARMAALGDSTVAIGYSFDSGNILARAGERWLSKAMRKAGYPVNADIWPQRHSGTGGATEAAAGGGFVDAVVGDATVSQGTGGGTGAYPGFLTRLPRVLMQRPALLIVQVTVNDVAAGLSTSTVLANNQTILTAATRAGSRVLFVLMRPGETGVGLAYPTSTQQQQRVDINAGIVSLCNATAGCMYWDPSPVYTTTAGTASAYNDATAIPASEQVKIVGFHPTQRGSELEADSFLARATALGLFTAGANYARDQIVAGAGADVTTAPTFNAGDNGGMSLGAGASGTFANGLRAASGPGAGLSTITGSVEANASTGGRSQVLALAPAGSGFQQATVTFSRVVANSGAGFATSGGGFYGMVEVAVEVETTDPDSIVSNVRLAIGESGHNFADGDTESDTTGGGVIPITVTTTRWHKLLVWLDGKQAKIDYSLTFGLLPGGKTQTATVKIKQHRVRVLTAFDPRTRRMLPNVATIATNGTGSAGTIPLRATLASGGVAPQGVRWWYRTAASNSSWTFAGDVVVPPGATTSDFTATGLTSGTSYHLRAEELRNGGILGAGFGRYNAEGSPSAVVTVTAP